MNITDIVKHINNLLNKVQKPADVLPAPLLKIATTCRSGLSPYKITTKIIEDNFRCGIPTGPNPDGSTNLINQYTYNLVNNIVDAIHNDAVVHNVMPSNSILVQAEGGNAGGAVTCTGSNIIDTICKGIMR